MLAPALYVEHDSKPEGYVPGSHQQLEEPIHFPEVAVTTTGNISVPADPLLNPASTSPDSHASSISFLSARGATATLTTPRHVFSELPGSAQRDFHIFPRPRPRAQRFREA